MRAFVDLGGSRMKARLGAGETVVVEHGGRWRQCLENFLPNDAPPTLSLSVPGIVVDHRVVACPGKLRGLEGLDLRAEFGADLVVNDAVAAGLGEALPGRTVVMTLGTGVGTAVIEDGRPMGAGPFGGGILAGQLPLSRPGTGPAPLDGSGRPGTIEAWCRAGRVGERDYPDSVARAIGALCLAFAPDDVVIGGGAVRPGGLDVGALQVLVDPLLWSGQRVRVRPARHGDAAALVGLARLAGEGS